MSAPIVNDLNVFPGMVRYSDDGSRAKQSVVPYANIAGLSDIIQRNTVLLATAVITEENLFSNGLFQNIYVLYRMFESMGCLPLLVVNKRPENMEKVPDYMKNLRLISVDELSRTPIPVKVYVEIGMSVDSSMRRYLKMCGARICKLYLGNILNIDVETPIFYPSMYFAHHVIGDLDEIWVSPHYTQHAEYARALNHVDLDKKEPIVVPYVWDSQILTRDGQRNFKWHSPAKVEDDVFLIVEPNISFQKTSLMPLMILEAWFRRNPSWKGEVVVVNGERLMLIPFFRETILKDMELMKAGRITFKGRMDILSILNTYPSAIPICHQWNNEYNYMTLEYFTSGYPVLHNSSDWSNYGYYYKGSDIQGASQLIDKIRSSHSDNYEVYRAHARALTWRHSPHNPEVQSRWAEIVFPRS
uniref:Glycosyltransferase n=1 Tax=viral metagenome TaxID=1070528 RepID=A0A6C0KMN5_9ZZZZ